MTRLQGVRVREAVSDSVRERHARERLWVIGFLWLSAALGLVGAIAGIVVTIVTWPNPFFLLLTLYGTVHAVAFRALAMRI
jgi:hypothetical protein